MEIYTQVLDKVTRDALRRLSDWLDHGEHQGRAARSRPAVAERVLKRPVPRSKPGADLGAFGGTSAP